MAQSKNIFTGVVSRFKAAARAFRVDSKTNIVDGSHDVDFGTTVDNQSALKNTAYYAGIRIIGENLASLPRSVKKWSERGIVKAPSHPLNRLLHRPNDYTNGFAFWFTMALWLKDWGNAYALIERSDKGGAIALHQAHPSNVRVTMSNGRKWYKVRFDSADLSRLNGTYSDEDMIHVMEVSTNGITGINPVVYNCMALEKAAAQEKFAAEFYRKGGNIKAVMETDRNLGDDQYEAFMGHFQQAAQNFDTPLLEYGVKYKQLSVNPVAAQLLQSETLSIQDVCRILGIPPHMVADLSHATFSNIEHQTIQFVQYTLRPMVKRFEAELEEKLLFDSERDYYSIDFNLDGLLRGDTAARSAYYHNAILDGYLSRNEVRELEGFEYKEGLDDMLYPLNTGVVGKEINQEENQ